MFFLHDSATTEIYTLSLHDALPISRASAHSVSQAGGAARAKAPGARDQASSSASACLHGTFLDRKSTRLNSSHSQISYAVFCLKKKKFDYYVSLYTLILTRESAPLL